MGERMAISIARRADGGDRHTEAARPAPSPPAHGSAAAEEDQRRSAFNSFAARSIASSSSGCASGGNGALDRVGARLQDVGRDLGQPVAIGRRSWLLEGPLPPPGPGCSFYPSPTWSASSGY
jgi:hypothetical protein